MPLRFSAEINRLRAALRGKHDSALIVVVRSELEQLGTAALAADNSTRSIATNAELLNMTVMDATPLPRTEEGRRLWQEFIAQGGQRGEYELQRKDGSTARVRYWAYTSVAPGVHVSLFVPVESDESRRAPRHRAVTDAVRAFTTLSARVRLIGLQRAARPSLRMMTRGGAVR